jgi:hypothetical protein
MREDLAQRMQESQERKDEGAFSFGTIFDKSKFPEGLEEWRPKKGEHIIDIIPFIAGSQHPHVQEGSFCYNIDVWVYERVGVNNDAFVVPSRNFKKPDPIAEYISSHNLDKVQYNRVRPKRKCIYLVWVHDTPEEERKGAQIWYVPHFFFEDKIDELSKIPRGGGVVNFACIDDKDGKQIAFNIKADGSFTDDTGKQRDSINYVGHQFLQRQGPIPDWVLDQVDHLKLDELIKMHPTYEEIYESFYAKKISNQNDQPSIPSGSSPQPAEASVPPAAAGSVPPVSEATKTCPAGGTFGQDLNRLAECRQCNHWDDCSDENQRAKFADRREGPPPSEGLASPAAGQTQPPSSPVADEEPPKEAPAVGAEVAAASTPTTTVKVRRRRRKVG